MRAEALAWLAGGAAAVAGVGLATEAARVLTALAPPGVDWIGQAVVAFASVGREGRDPGAKERRRLLALGALAAFAAGLVLIGWAAGLAAALAGTVGMSRALAARRARYRRLVAAGASAMATALADAVSAGNSVRGAVGLAAEGLGGPAGAELARVATEIELGAPTADALEDMRARVGCAEIDAIVAATRLQSRAGGDLARLLRDLARAFEDQVRVEGEVRAATAQARFTGLVVVLLPVGGAVLGELAAPGFVAGMLGDPLSGWLLTVAVVLQVVAAVAIRRLGKVGA